MKRVLNLNKEQLKNFWSIKASDFATEDEKKEYKFFNVKSETYFAITVELMDSKVKKFQVIAKTAKEAIAELIDGRYITKDTRIIDIDKYSEIFLIMER